MGTRRKEMRLLIGTVSLDTKSLTEIFLKTLGKALANLGHLTEDYVEMKEKCSPCAQKKIDSIKKQIKVVVIDNGSSDNVMELADKYPWADFIRNEENIGVAPAWNQFIKEGFDNEANPLYDHYLVCNNDVFWTESSIKNFIDALGHDPEKRFGWVSSFMNDYKEPELTTIKETVELENIYWSMRPEADDVENTDMEALIKATYAKFGGIEKFANNLVKKYGISIHKMHPKAPLFSLSKECIKKVGLFDEYGAPTGLHEDADYCKRIAEDGTFEIGCAFGCYIHHFSMMTRTKSKYKGEWWVEEREKNFTEKWGETSKGEKVKDRVKRLDIGSGYGPKGPEHYYHMEIDKKFSDIEFLHDVATDLPFEDDEFDEIYASNVLEHVSHLDAPGVLYNWISKLKQGGKVHIRVPNMKWICTQYAQGNWVLSFTPGTELNAMHAIFGGDNPGVPHIHKSGFDLDNLSQLFKDCGLTNITDVSDPNSWELRLEGIKE